MSMDEVDIHLGEDKLRKEKSAMSKTIKVSDATYESIHKMAEKNGQGISEVADSLLSGSVETVSLAIKDLAKDEKVQEMFDGILRRKPNGVVYMCLGCNHPLDEDDEPDECPWCHAKLDWKAIPQEKSNWLGWGLGGLILLSLLGLLGGGKTSS